MLELYELMLKEENQKSLECIYQFYLEQDKKQKQKSRESMELKSSSIDTVLEENVFKVILERIKEFFYS